MSNEGSRQRPLMLTAGPSLGSPGLAALLSALLPGLGQVYQHRWIKGALMLLLPIFAFALAGAFVVNADPLTAWVLRNATYVTFLAIATALVYHVYVVVDAFAGRMRRFSGRHLIDYGVLALVTTTLIVTYGTIYRESTPWAALMGRIFAPITRQPAPTVAGDEAAPVWTGNERLNVLVLGIDTRDGDRTTQNTDTMIVVSLDPLNRTAAMLSIPRDVYVNRPGTFQGKINGAFAFGGPDLARRVVNDLLGIKIHSYALVNFDAFNRIVNGVGGVIVDVKRPVRDEFYPTVDYGVERVNISAGPQLMFGDTALKYARSRHDSNDYSRARRQQDVLAALRLKLSEPSALRALPSLMDGVGTTIETDFDPSNVLPLAGAAAKIASSDITSDVLYPCGSSYPHCELTYDSDGGFFLIPDVAKVRDLAASLFYDPKVRQEGARVEVQNTGARSGVAKQVADRLEARAFDISAVTDGSSARSAVVLRNSTKRYTAEQLRTQLGLPMETADGAGGADIVIRIGNDFRSFATDLAR
ncbi:MAG TPA: LCP family protein [Candidatus Limnocylindria bacterium]|nr:LCP family protein [Candidatus Limnocylindria bacterium]